MFIVSLIDFVTLWFLSYFLLHIYWTIFIYETFLPLWQRMVLLLLLLWTFGQIFLMSNKNRHLCHDECWSSYQWNVNVSFNVKFIEVYLGFIFSVYPSVFVLFCSDILKINIISAHYLIKINFIRAPSTRGFVLITPDVFVLFCYY